MVFGFKILTLLEVFRFAGDLLLPGLCKTTGTVN
jgi:hypothetical protein